MADKKRDNNRDTWGSIFDFIFAETQKPEDKRRPVKPTNINAASETVEALTTVLEKPGFFVSDQIMQSIDDGLNLQFIEAYLGKTSPQAKNKISTKDLLSIINNPNEYFDKAYQKANPKFNVAEWAGKTYRGLNASGWAKKHGITDKDTLWAIDRAAASFDDPDQRLEMVQDGSRVIRKSAAIESVAKVSKDLGLGSLTSASVKAIDKAGKMETSADLRNALVSAGITDQNFLNNVVTNFNNQSVKISNKENGLIKSYKSKPFSYYDENTKLYRTELSNYLRIKANVLGNSSDSSDKELAETYAKASLLVDNWKKSEKDNKKYLVERSKELSEVRKKLKNAGQSGATQSEIRKLQKKEKELIGDIKFLKRNRTIDSFDKYKGMWTSMNNFYLKGNLVGSIMDGTFFSSDNTLLNPVEDDWMGLTFTQHETMKEKSKDENGEIIKTPASSPTLFNIAKNDGFFKLVLDDEGKSINSFNRRGTNFYNKTMTELSYFTPKQIFQIDGSYWAYRLYKNRMMTFEQIMNLSNNQAALAKKLVDMDLFYDDGRMNFSRFGQDMNSGKYAELMGDLKSLFENEEEWKKYFGDNKDVLKLFEQFKNKDKNLNEWFKRLSFIARTKDAIKTKITNYFIGKPRDYLASMLMKRFGSNADIKFGIKIWKEGGGIQSLMRGFAQSIVKKLGLEKAFFSHLLASAISGGLSTIAFTAFKLIGKVIVAALIGIVVILLGGSMMTSNMLAKYGTTSYQSPGSCVACEGFTPEDLVNPDDIDIEVPPPSNSSCPLGSSSFRCNQGYADGRGSFSHNNIKSRKPVDIDTSAGAYFYAPQYCDDGGCRITGSVPATSYCAISGVPYIGEMIYFNDGQGNVFILVHTKALVPVQQEVRGGEAVAYIYGDGELQSSGCWSGGHLHLEITHNGGYIDPLNFLQAMGCNVPSESQCSN